MKVSVLLTPEQKSEMARMYGAGMSVKECAQLFNVDASTVLKWVRVAGIAIRPMSIAKRLYTCDEYAFERSDAESLYWLGFLLADGCIHKYERGSFALSISLQEQDVCHLESLRLFLCSNHPIYVEAKSHSVRLNIRSNILCESLMRRGFTQRKSLTLCYPPHGYFYRRHFIRGYFDGDGSVYVYEKAHCQPAVSFVGTHAFLEKLQEVLVFEAGVNANAIRNHPHSGAKYLSYSGRGNAQKFYDYLYTEGGSCLERKKAKFEYALSYHQRKQGA